MGKNKIKAGDTVEYVGVLGKIKVKVLAVKGNGKLSLATRELGLIKNVSVLPSKVRLLTI